MAAKIFISYRRDDSAGYAGRVHDQLVEKLGSNVFMDVDGIPLGSNFVKALNDEVAKCSALLAVIGPDWLDARDKKGQRRLDNPHDFVRVEIGAALNRQIPVIPILLEGTTIPSADQLPSDLQELSLRNGINVRHDSFRTDIDRLVRGLQAQLRGGNWRDAFASGRGKGADREHSWWLTRRNLLAATATIGGAAAVAYIVKRETEDRQYPENAPTPSPKAWTTPSPKAWTPLTRPAPVAPSQRTVDAITKIAAQSAMGSVSWGGRSVAPLGYIKGMALVYARVFQKLKVADAAAIEMANASTANPSDALGHYASQFAALGMRNDISGPDTLRHLFVLLMGLGMRQSSGRYCAGTDRSATNTSSTAAEAGLFQTSFDSSGASPLLLLGLFEYYSTYPSGFREVFSEGVQCSADDLQNFGTGPGLKFQQLSKESPAFAVEFAGVVLRNLRMHFGPINRREAELRPECDDMLRQVQRYVDTRADIGVL